MALSTALMVAGTVVSSYGQVQEGKVAQNTAEYNAKLAEQQAVTLDQENRENMIRLRAENNRLMGKQAASYAASGIRIDTGSPLEAQADTAAILELSLLDQNRASQAQQSSLFGQAGALRVAGKNYAMAGKIRGTATLFSGIGNALAVAEGKSGSGGGGGGGGE